MLPSYAFAYCYALESLTLPSTLRSVGAWAFSESTGLKNLTLNEGLETIGGNAFRYAAITELTIPGTQWRHDLG